MKDSIKDKEFAWLTTPVPSPAPQMIILEHRARISLE